MKGEVVLMCVGVTSFFGTFLMPDISHRSYWFHSITILAFPPHIALYCGVFLFSVCPRCICSPQQSSHPRRLLCSRSLLIFSASQLDAFWLFLTLLCVLLFFTSWCLPKHDYSSLCSEWVWHCTMLIIFWSPFTFLFITADQLSFCRVYSLLFGLFAYDVLSLQHKSN